VPTAPSQSVPLLVGLDVGGTKTLAVAIPQGAGAAEPVASVRSTDEPTAGSLAALVEELMSVVPGPGVPRPAAIGVGIAGWVDREGVARRAPHLPGLVGVDLAGGIGGRLAVPTVVDNDANCTALAALQSRSPVPRCLVAVTFGTGIGAGLVVEGELVRGAHGYAGEPGHMVLDPGGPQCPCGQRGCWERFASGSGLARAAAEAVARGELDRAVFGGSDAPSGEAVVGAARAGEGAARALMESFAAWVARGLAAVVNMVDPDVIALGGGLVASADTWLPEVQRLIAANPTTGHRHVTIEVVAGSEAAGAVGAALRAGRSLRGVR
jgi:glucokinase